jgi:trypsin-like peptidase
MVLVALLTAFAETSRGQNSSGEDLALALRPNVVRILANPAAGTPAQGFGFVVGESSGQLYIVTADHVVRGEGPGEIDKKPIVIFFQDQGKRYEGELLGTELPRGQGDLAVLRVRTPETFSLNRNAIADDVAKRDADVWFIGKLGEWYVPTRPGAVNEIELSGVIKLDALPVSVGTSGAPLISQRGILGMIVTDAGTFSEATSLDVIRRAIEKWNYPWQLVAVGSQPPKAPQPNPPVSAAEERQIIVWRVGSPHRGDTPDTTVPLDLDLSAEKIGRKLKIEAFPAKGFAQTFFDAFKKNQEPDILAIDNYGIIEGITTPLGNFTGIGTSETIRQKLVQVTQSLRALEDKGGGWEFLLSTSKNYGAAKLLALRPPACNPTWQLQALPRDLQTNAARFARAYLQGPVAWLQTLEDADYLRTDPKDRGPLQLSETKECGFGGNDHLAFVPIVFSYESANAVGQIPVLLILRKQQNQWQLLTASTDPISNTEFVSQVPQLMRLLQNPWVPDRKPIPARLLSPEEGQSPQPAAGQRFGNFTWQPSTSTDVVAEIVEFAYNGDARLFMRLSSEKGENGQISDGLLWTTRGLWKWRVWSISNGGAVSFSTSRSFQH